MKKLLLLIFAVASTLGFAQTQVAPFLTPAPQFFDANGNPLTGGKVCFFAAGTTTPQATYSESTGTTLNSNPVVLNSAGFPQSGAIFLTTAAYKIVTAASTANSQCSPAISTVDNVTWSNLASTLTTLTVNGATKVASGTAATSGANQSSPNNSTCGNYWNGTASAQDCWAWTDTFGTGTNPTSTLTLTHSGSSGTTALNFAPPLTFGTINVTGNASVGNNLAVTNNATVGGTLGVTGLSTVGSSSVTGNETVGGTFGVTGLSTLASLTVTGNTTFSVLNANNIESVIYADQATGADCGAKINAQDVALGSNPGQIVVNRACGTTWTTAVSLGANHSLVFNQPGLFTLSAAVTMGQGSAMSGLPNSTVGNPCDNLAGTCLRAANTSNLSALVIVSGSGVIIRNVSLDGNKANNPTGGVGLKTNLSARTKLENMWIENFPSHGWWVVSSGTSNQSAVPKVSSSVFLNNSGDGVYIVGSSDFFAQDSNEFESNGIKASVNTSAGGVATFVSGSAWSSDASLVGTLVQINGIPCQVSAVTLTTFSTAHCRSSVNSLTGAIVYWGGGIELSDSGAARIIGSDFGGNFGPSIVMYGVGAGLTSIQNQVVANQFGNNFTQEIMVLADGIGDDQTFTAGEEDISNNTFLNKNGSAQANTFDDVFLRDSQNDTITANNFSSGTITTRWYVQVTEHTAGVGINENVAVNSFNAGSLGTGTLNCPNTNGCPVVIIRPLINAGVSQGSGLKHQRNTGCTTAAGVGSVCNPATITWATAFPDTSYSVSCTAVFSGGQGFIEITKTAAAIGISLINAAAAAVTVTETDCIAIHD